MAFFGLFKKKKYEFSDTDRAEAEDIKRQRTLLKKQELQISQARQELQLAQIQQRIDNIIGTEEEEEDSLEHTIMQAFMPVIAQRFGKQSPPPDAGLNPGLTSQSPFPGNNPASNAGKVNFSDEQIEAIADGLPIQQKALAKIAGETKIRAEITRRFPKMDEDSVERAIQIIKEA
jgi:hypothetical protein